MTLREICLYEPQWEMIRWPLIPHVESSGGFGSPASAGEASHLFSAGDFPASTASLSEWRMAEVLLEVHDGCTCVCRSVESRPGCSEQADLWPQLTGHRTRTLQWQQEHHFLVFLSLYRPLEWKGFQNTTVYRYSEQNESECVSLVESFVSLV